MMKPHRAMPDLFGRATLVLGDHAELRSTIDTLRKRCAELAGAQGPVPEDLGAVAKDFATLLVEHFAVEERAEYFGALAEEAPELAGAIGDLIAEHRVMESLARSVRAAVEAKVEGRAFVSRLTPLLDQLSAHERREAALLDTFFHGHGLLTTG